MRLKVANAAGRPTLGITLLLASLSMVSPLSTDTFLPSLPTIAEEFHLTPWEVQQIITAYLLPFAFFALVHGPLSDALGRRRGVIGGLVLHSIRSIGCHVAAPVRTALACHGLDKFDNDFVIGLLGPELYPLSCIVQRMRKTKQTSQHLERLGPFWIGKVAWQSK